MRCLRYMTFRHAQASLHDGLFKVSRLSEFNDPAECRVRFINSGEVPALRNYVHDNFDRLKLKCIQMTESFSQESQDRFTEDYIYESYLSSCKRVDQPYEIETFGNIILIMCLVKERGLKAASDTLFWSHYGDSGKGVRITFDFEEKHKYGVYYLKDVDYAEEVPSFDLSSFDVWMQGTAFMNYIEQVVTTKGSAWSYENEVRMIVPIKHPMNQFGFSHIHTKIENGRELLFVGIDHSEIRRVDFGPRVTDKEVLSFVNESNARQETMHIHWFKTEFDPKRYSYAYRRIAS